MKQDQEQTRINITPSGDNLTIRYGDAEEIMHPKSINITGTLRAPHQFLIGRGTFNQEQTHLIIDGKDGKLKLVLNDVDPHTTHTITGSITKDSELSSFQINSSKRWTVRDFLKFIREKRYHFDSKDEHDKLLSNLRKWGATVETIVKEHNDNTGNSLFQLETKVQKVDGFVSAFTLNMPIFQGYPKEKFKVEIGLDPKTTGVDLYLISDDLTELEFKVKEKILSDELKNFDSYTFSKVVVS